MRISKKIRGITLIELILAITISVMLVTAGVLLLNPVELLQQGRDTTRLSDLRGLNTALELLQENESQFWGTPSVVYVSLPSNQSDCSDLGLPTLPSPWVYECKPSSSYRKTDGTGWIPVNFNAITGGPSFTNLSIDPINSTSSGYYYYTYVGSEGWELNANLESSRYGFLGEDDKVSTDGGDDENVFEIGFNFVLAPLLPGPPKLVGHWKFDEGSGNFTADASGRGNDGQLMGNPTWVSGKNGGYALSFNGNGQYVRVGNSSSLQPANLTFTAWVKRTTDWSGTNAGYFFNAKGFGSAGSGPGWLFLHGGTEPMWIFIDGNTEAGVVYTPSNLFYSLDTWVHIAFTFDANIGAAYSYKNGDMQISQVPGGTISTDADDKYIGRSRDGYQDFNGVLDDVRIYDGVLSPTEIKAIYNGTL